MFGQGIVASFRSAPDAWFSALMASGDACGYIGPQLHPQQRLQQIKQQLLQHLKQPAADVSTIIGPVLEWQLSRSCTLTPTQWLLLVAVSAPTRCGEKLSSPTLM